MIFLHELPDTRVIPTAPLPDGIHYAAKKILRPEALLANIKQCVLNALVQNDAPAGYIRGIVGSDTIAGRYDKVDNEALCQQGINPITLFGPIPYLWGHHFHFGGKIEMIADRGGISRAFKSYLIEQACRSDPLPAAHSPPVIVPVPTAPNEEPVVLPIHRAIAAHRFPTVGMRTPFLE